MTKDTDKDRISFEADAGKTSTIDISETNINELKEQASTFLNQLHPDLINAKNELQTAIDLTSKELGTVLTKVKLIDQLYRSYLNKAENIYYLTDKDNLTYSQIDTLYNQLRKLRKTLLENTGDLEDYQNAENQFTDS